MMRAWKARGMVFVAGMLVCAVALNGCRKKAEGEDTEAGETAVRVQAEHPRVGPLAQEVVADAILAPLAQAALAARISAPIQAEYVRRGDRVHKGQLLVMLENRDLQGAALDSRGSVAQAQAAYATATQATVPEDLQKVQLDVQQARANLDVANRTADERKRLLREGAIAGRDTDTAIAAAVQAEAAYQTAVKHLQSVEKVTQRTSVETVGGQLTSARGKLESAVAQASYAQLRSPIDGVVTDRPFFPGETAAAGTPVITVMETASLLAKLHLAQATAPQLKVGGSAQIQIPGVDEPQPAVLSFISPVLDPGSTTVEVWLKLANAGRHFRVGTPVRATLRGYTIPQALQVPPAALLPAEDGSTAVLVVQPDGTVRKQHVTVGLRTVSAVQILDGLTASDTVVTEGGYGLEDGAKVKTGSAEENGEENDKNSDKNLDKDPDQKQGKGGGNKR